MRPAASSRAVLRRLVAAALVVGAVLAAGGGQERSAAADSDDEQAFVDAINELRADLGLAELVPHDELAQLAREHAARMAAAGEIFHADPISAGLEAEWLKLGENVGVGAGVEVLIDAFVASPGHYANIVDPSFTRIGVGVVWEGDALYTTHRFMQTPVDAGADGEDSGPPATTSTVSPAIGERSQGSVPVGSVSPERVEALFALLDRR